MIRALGVSICAAALTTASCTAGSTAGRSSLPLHPCHLTGGRGQVVDALCGALVVPEDRTTETGRTLSLSIAVVKATGRKPASDALFFLAGGPGQSALEAYPELAGSFSKVNLTRDIVIVDQRGTGHSGELVCPATDLDETTEGPSDDPARVTACRTALEAKADLRQYGTANAMDDLDDVREKLGYPTIDLYGASYGTRAALVYLRRHESHVRAVVIDGVAPPDWPLPGSFPRDGQNALDSIFARCAADPACHGAFPDLDESLATLLAPREGRVKVVIAHPTTAAPTTLFFTRDGLASTIHGLTYESETAALLPLLIHTAAKTGDLRPLAAQSIILSDLVKLSIGEHLSVLCAEDIPFLDPAKVASDSAGTYLGEAPVKRYIEACKGWPRASVTAADRAPVSSAKPVLLLSGELDPVTPPQNAAAAARTLSNSFLVTVPGEGHGTLQRSCTRRIVDDFLERASVSGLKTSCLEDAKPMRFFTSFAGPQP